MAKEEIQGCNDPMNALDPIFPTPGGRMDIKKILRLKEFYNND